MVNQFAKFVSMIPYLPDELQVVVMNIKDPGKASDLIASNLNISNISSESGEPRAGCKSLPGTVNPAEYLKLSASSSVLTSARFPYITPGGLLPLPTMNADPSKKDIQCWDLIVDGGYVDNEGVITARELLKRLIESEPSPKDTTPEKNFAKSYRLIVLRLSNQPSPVLDVKNVPLPDRDSPGQLFSTFLNQQNATGRDLVNDFSKYVSAIGGCMIEINALHDDAPLGWTLSEKSRAVRTNASGPQLPPSSTVPSGKRWSRSGESTRRSASSTPASRAASTP